MRAFEVKKGTVAKAIQDGKEWTMSNFAKIVTKKDNLFFIEEMIVDPAGIASMACVPGCVTIGSAWAGAGYYGFRRDGWSMLVAADEVTVH